ncbi:MULTISPECIES: GNAT family N-acetyltransferase [unclassified Pseudoxanthomonas]|uniref:GNAT family N-acetyltransferase n=1 Tax=unclassified Pseudoxanthomonas TaxID=2645906 RepID=UPI003078667D
MLRISADPTELDIALVHDFLSRHSYWAAGIPRETLERALANSVCFGGYIEGRQVAFARAVTDQATFAYLADVFVIPEQRGHGYGRAIVEAVLKDTRLQGLRRWHLVTLDMQPLYRQLGFTELEHVERHMQKHDPDVYRRGAGG